MQIVFLFYEGMTALDLVGPHEILSRLPGAKVRRVAEQPGSVRTDSGLVLIAEYGLSDVSQADVLVIPGAGSATTLRKDPHTLAWVRSIHATTIWTVSVCTGSLILGAAGILSGLRATTHWAAFDRLSLWGAVAVGERVVERRQSDYSSWSVSWDRHGPTARSKDRRPAVCGITATRYRIRSYKPPFDVGSPQKASPALLEPLRARLVASFESRE